MSQLFAHPGFLALVAVLLIVALAFVLPPLLFGDSKQRELRTRRRALEALRDELEPADYRRRMERLDQEQAANGKGTGLPRGLVGLVLVAVPLCTLFLYNQVGTPEGLRGDTGPDAELRDALGELAARVNEDPLDLQSWTEIGMIWKSMRQFGIAEAAFRRVLFHDPENSVAVVELAETLLFGSGQPHLPTEGRQMLDQLLVREPDNQKALWLSGFNAMQLGDRDTAIAQWTRLESLLPEGSVKAQVRSQLNQARAMPMDDVHAGLAMTARTTASAPTLVEEAPTAPAESAPRPAAAVETESADRATPAQLAESDRVAAASADAATGPVEIEVEVSLSPQLLDRLSGRETVFVFARAVNGPPAPLAVKRFPVAALPTRVVLSEADAMAAGLTLATFPEVRIVARVSRSGGVMANPGDLEGGTEAIDPRTSDRVAVVVDRVIGDNG